MSTATLVSVDEYLGMTDKPYREYRDGKISVKAMPTKLHAKIQRILMKLLEQRGVEPFPELTVRISPTKYPIPDVAVASEFAGPYPIEPVLLCCEILSPEDRLGATLAKCEEYHAWGVPFTWVIDPVNRAAWEYPANGEPVRSADTLRAGDISISVAELFSALP